ncbi:MAG: phytanoyl-CoA dioxygenase family protein [Herpetosiphonaceae bacterium]|nr:phytanoyl-CoA dioxygenase family protein [Herpetosiphonaceae bacterium]
MNIREALEALGVRSTTLSDAEKEHLDHDGYLPLPEIVSPEQVARMGERLDELSRLEGAAAGLEVHQEAGTDRLADLVNKDPMFEVCFTHPRVLAAIAHVLGGELKLYSLNSRAALPGHGLQGLHADWSGPVAPGDYYVCNSIWLLDDFTAENGATRLVPGTHRSGKAPHDVMADPSAAHPDEIQVIAPAGTVVIFNSHTWHGGTLNRSDQRRRALHSAFCRRDQPQQLDQRRYIRPETTARLSAAAQYILDV